ncbi:MFS transporter [Amylibacter sp.]|nr:MFS transporter [Amylibacter sp.]
MHFGLVRYSFFSGMLAFAGLPIYLHAPKFFLDNYDISLTLIGLTLLALRCLDFIQDPLIGRALDSMRKWHSLLVLIMGMIITFSMMALFAVSAIGDPLIWFIVWMILLFSSFSVLSILFYSQGVQKAKALGEKGHIRLAVWRESGGLIGVCLASALPAVFKYFEIINDMTWFSISFTIIVFISIFLMKKEWHVSLLPNSNLKVIFKDPVLRRLIIIALLNAAPLAVTTTLFLFYVEYCLGPKFSAGLFLVIFFIAAALSVPIWGILGRYFSPRKILIFAMLSSISIFAFVLSLGAGDYIAFAIVCCLSGFTLGADMTILPAVFARRIDHIGMNAGQAFGVWSFCAKFTLAASAAFVLPALDWVGFSTIETNTAKALWALTLLYAGLPCILKLGAVMMLSSNYLKEI